MEMMMYVVYTLSIPILPICMDIKRVPYADIHSNYAHILLAIIVNLIMTMSYIFQNIKLICFSFKKKKQTLERNSKKERWSVGWSLALAL